MTYFNIFLKSWYNHLKNLNTIFFHMVVYDYSWSSANSLADFSEHHFSRPIKLKFLMDLGINLKF